MYASVQQTAHQSTPYPFAYEVLIDFILKSYRKRTAKASHIYSSLHVTHSLYSVHLCDMKKCLQNADMMPF